MYNKPPIFLHMLFAGFLLFGTSLQVSGEELFKVPDYFSSAIKVGKEKIFFQKEVKEKEVNKRVYLSKDGQCALVIDDFLCERNKAGMVMKNIYMSYNESLKKVEGKFDSISATELCILYVEGEYERECCIFQLPSGVQSWTYTKPVSGKPLKSRHFKKLLKPMNRLRYESALKQGNVSMVFWGACALSYAKELLKSRGMDKGLKVLHNVLDTSPNNYEAHAAVIQYAKGREEATISASVILKNCEDKKLRKKAEGFLDVKKMAVADLPVLVKENNGLHAVFIALPPCDVDLVQESSYHLVNNSGIMLQSC